MRPAPALLATVLALSPFAHAQDAPRTGPHRLDGPRAGVTFLDPRTTDRINERFPGDAGEPRLRGTNPAISQFGWQLETRLFQASNGLTGVSELVLLAGGLERNLVLPSGTFLVGLRTVGGLEVGVGPNLSLAGTGFAVALGMNNNLGDINIPINVAAVFSQGGPRISLLTGFTLASRRY